MRTTWRGRIGFTAVADEVTFGPDGAAFLLEAEPRLLGDAVICGEGPGDMTLGVAEKGVCWIALEARAPSGQGMLTHRGTSATARLAAAIAELDALNGTTGTCPGEIAGVGADADGHRSRVSLNVGTIAGGHFVSQVATRAVAEIDVRIPPGLAVADVEAWVGAVTARYTGMSFRRIKAWEPNWTGLDAPVVRAVAAAHSFVRGSPPVPAVRLPASDASRWRARGVPAVCYGPQPELVAGIDDYVHERDLVDCAKVYALAALSYLNGPG
jgi:succinyl-diaminopimelate desuccinylase